MQKSTGSKMVQRNLKLIDTGFSPTSHPCLLHTRAETNGATTQARGPAPPKPTIALPKTEIIPPARVRSILRGI